MSVVRLICSVCALALSLYHIYTGAFGSPEAYMHRTIHLGLALVLLYVIQVLAWLDPNDKSAHPDPEGGAAPAKRNTLSLLVSLVAFAGTLAGIGYLFVNYEAITRDRYPYITDLSKLEIWLGVALVFAVIHATWTTMGPALAIVALVFLCYPFIGPWLPGLLKHQGYSLETVIDGLVYTTDGIFGVSLGISASFIVLFVIFAAFLEISGFSQLMLALGRGATGNLRGGPAKMCVFASTLMGMISGSSVANVVTVGGFTIPLMKRTGYSKNFAGAVEAAASTGGQFMPPVMGAQAFIMAQFTGVPYFDIAIYSLVPALLFYYGIWVTIDLEAREKGLGGIPASEVPNWQSDVLARMHLLLPIVLLVGLMAYGFTPAYAAVGSLVTLLVVSLLLKVTRFTLKHFISALEAGARYSIPVVSATAVSGIIILAVTLTGLGSRFSDTVISVAGGNLFLGLVMAMFASLVLGMGLPTVPAYIVQVGLIVPALVKMGLDVIVAHLFVIYFSCLSMVTPPVALSAYAAAGLSGGNAFRTGLIASRLALVGFIVPFMFCYQNGLLLMGTWTQILSAIVTAVLGVFALGLALQGYYLTKLGIIERLLAATAASLLVYSGWISDIAGILCLGIVLLWQRHKARGSQTRAVPG